MQRAELASIRFGYGLGPGRAPVAPGALLQGLAGPDRAAEKHPMLTLAEATELFDSYGALQKASRSSNADDKQAFDAFKKTVARSSRESLRLSLARVLDADSAFRERLVAFWADHFTARPKTNKLTVFVQPYLDTVLRPHLAGRFADMLKAVAESPLMLTYLDQAVSVGPDSSVGKKRGRGLNENYARELLELHTLGVGGGYGQDDVRQLAELLTGLSFRGGDGFVFRTGLAEPGAETLLGEIYGGGPPKLADIHAALDALAVHPDTARHIARKLAVHFVADTPPQELVDALARAWHDTGGDLTSVYAALLAHPAAWARQLAKIKQPFDFIASSLVALGMDGTALRALPLQQFNRHIDRPMRVMGQRFFAPPGPDGWPEEATAWITPQGLASRIRWAQDSPRRLVEPLPDPRALAASALGGLAPPGLLRAVGGAESQIQGVALVLSSPTFNRR